MEAVDNTINYEVNLFSQGEPKTTRDRFTSDLFYRLLDKRYRDELRNAQGLSYDPYVQLTCLMVVVRRWWLLLLMQHPIS